MNTKMILRTLVTVLLIAVTAGAASAQVSLRFEPEDGTVGMEESRRLGVYLDDPLNVRTIELTVQYDEEFIASLAGGKGALYDALPPGTVVWEDFDDSTPGEWSGYAVSFSSTAFVTGPGELFYWDVEGITPGEAQITAVSVAIYDETGAPIADVTLDGTTLTVVPPIEDPVLDAMPEFHPGTDNTPTWNDVGATDYQVQVSSDSGFGTIFGDSGWISGTSHEFTGLSDGVPYYYRVRARLDSPSYETGWSLDTVVSTPDDTGPQSAVAALSPFQTSLTFDVPWSGSDAGSGLDRVELYVNGSLYSTDNDPGAGQPFSFTAPAEGPYEFTTVAYDGVNNQEDFPVTADASTMVDVTAPSGGLVVNGGATVTPDQVVALASSVIDAVDMRFTNTENDFSAPESQWQTYADDLAWTLTAGDGLKTVYGEYRDEAGNILQLQADIELDQTPPADSLVINDDDTYTNNTLVTLTMAGSDAVEMRFTNSDGDWTAPESSWQTYAASASWTVPATEGELTVFAEYRDEAGNVSPATDTIIFDSLPPTADFVINGGDTVTNDPFVDLTISGIDAVEMRFRNAAGSYGAWQAFAGALAYWELDAGDGLNTIFGQFRDAAGNELEVSHAITLDTTPPTATMVINGDAGVTNDLDVTLDLSWDDAVEMRFSNDGASFSAWAAVATPVDWMLTGPDGTQTVHAEFRDAAGNILAITDSIDLDTTPPAGAMLINNGDSMATDLNVMLTSVITGAVEMRFSNDNTTWSSWVGLESPYAWLLDDYQGSHTVYGQYRDVAGNVLNLQDSITVDSEAPEGGFVINDGDDLTNDPVVTLTSSVSGATEMRFSNVSGDWGGAQSYWRSYAVGQTWTLEEVEGERLVYAQYRDTAGNILDAQDGITLDTIGPEASFVVNGDAPLTNDTAVMLDITPGDAVLMEFSNDGSTYSGWQPAGASLAWDLDAVEGERTVFGRFQDQAGNITESSDAIILDTIAPEATLVINNDDAVTNQLTVDLALSAPDAVEMRFRTGAGSYGAWVAFAPTATFDLDDVQGEQTVLGEFRDAAGNIAETSDTIVYDTAAPTGGFVINDDDAYTNTLDVTLTSAVVDAVTMQFSNDGVNFTVWEPYNTTKTWSLVGGDGVLSVYGRFADAAGNVLEAQDTIELDTMPPAAALLINDDDPGTISLEVTLGSDAPEAVEMRFHNEGSTFGAWEPFQDTRSWMLNDAQGSQTVYAEYRDAAGNVSAASDAIIVDTIAPDAVIVINGGDELTNSAEVLITNTVTGADFMRFRNEGGTYGAWEDLASTRTWTLEGADGLHTVYAQFRDGYGNVTETTDSITLDATAPVAAFVINGDAALTNSRDVTLNIDVDGATEMQFRNEGGTWSGFQPVAATLEWQLPAGDGLQTVQGQFRDAAGNVQQTQDAITLDTVGPEASFVINNDEEFTASTLVTLTITGGDATEMQFANDGEAFGAWLPLAAELAWELPAIDGLQVVHGRFRDAAGNETETSDSITLDTTAPAVPVLAGEPLFTQGTSNTLSWNAVPESTYLLQRADDAAFSSGVVESGWIPDTSFEFTGLTDGNPYHYRVKAKDALDNETDWSGAESSTQDATAPVSAAGTLAAYQTGLEFEVPWSGSDATSGLAQVELFVDDGSGSVSAGVITNPASPGVFSFTAPGDGTYGFHTVATDHVGLVEAAPAGPDASTTVDTGLPAGGFVINDDEIWTMSPEVVLTIDVSEAMEMRFRNAGGAWTPWESYAGTRNWTLEGADGLLTVEGEFRDEAGNVLASTDDIQLDTELPEGQMAINGGAEVTSSVFIVLNHTVTGAAQMRHSDNGGDWTEWIAYAADRDWELPAGDGIKTVFGEFRDEAGNTLALSDTIELDTTAPDVPVMNDEPLFTMGLANAVSWTGEGEEFLVQAATSPGFDSGLLDSGWIVDTTFEFAGLTSGQIYYYRVSARDAQGNVSFPSAAVFSTQDDDQPVATALELDPYRNTTEIPVAWEGMDATSGLASVALHVDDGSGWILHSSTTSVDPAEPFLFTAPADGTYRFQVVGTDVAGNLEAIGPEAEAMTLVDQVAPEGILAINAGEESTSLVDVILNSAVTDALEITGMRFTNTEGVWPGGPDSWLPYAEAQPWVLDEGDGTKTVFAEYRDAAGNILALNDTIELDTTPPGMPVFAVEPDFTPGDANTLYWEAVDAVAYFLQSSEDEDFHTIAANSGWVTTLEHTFSGLSDGQTYYYRIRARDALDNETEYSEAVSSTQDATAPTSAAGALDPYQAMADITVPWSGEDATSGLASVRLYVNDGTLWELAGETTEVETPVPFVYTAEEAGEYSFYTVAVDLVGNEEEAPAVPDAVTLVDFSAPSPATDLHAEPGHETISLSWANPDDEDVAAIEIWAALWTDSEMVSTYPEYDDIAPAPARPGSRAAASTNEQWTLIQTLDPGTTGFVHSEGMPSRGVYFYEIFVRDLAGNYSAQVPVNDKATNYRLGDVDNNHVIDVYDITQLGATYGSVEGDGAYNNELDVGPTDDNSGYGVPTTDNEIGFEDLAIMALNYAPGKAAVPVEGSSEPALTWFRKDETTWVLGLLEPCSSLQALQFRMELPAEMSATVEAGEVLAEATEFFLGTSKRDGFEVGLAMLGQGRVIAGEGELLVITLGGELDELPVQVEARDAQNASLAVALSDEPIQVLPAMYKLANNFPNPFNPQTTISFDLPEPQPVRLVIYDLRGRQVRELVSGPMEAGFHSVVWDGTGQQGRRMASGVYFYRISAGPLQDTRRMMLVK